MIHRLYGSCPTHHRPSLHQPRRHLTPPLQGRYSQAEGDVGGDAGGGGAEEPASEGAVAGSQGRARYAGGDHAGQKAGRESRSGSPLPP